MSRSLCILWASLMFTASAGLTADSPADAVKVRGRVQITARKGGLVSAAIFKTNSGQEYNLVMDATGRDFARVMHRQRAEILGAVSERDGAK